MLSSNHSNDPSDDINTFLWSSEDSSYSIVSTSDIRVYVVKYQGMLCTRILLIARQSGIECDYSTLISRVSGRDYGGQEAFCQLLKSLHSKPNLTIIRTSRQTSYKIFSNIKFRTQLVGNLSRPPPPPGPVPKY